VEKRAILNDVQRGGRITILMGDSRLHVGPYRPRAHNSVDRHKDVSFPLTQVPAQQPVFSVHAGPTFVLL
jgi:hypothetical protein